MKFISFKIVVEAQQAKSVPPLGPILGQHQINIMQFCKEYNQLTLPINEYLPIRVVVLRYENKSFSIVVKKPSFIFLINHFFNFKDEKIEKNTIMVDHLFDLMVIDFEWSSAKDFISHCLCLFASLSILKVQIV